jgi:hypothetical protein
VKSVRFELLNHVRVTDVDQLQWYLDEYRVYFNSARCHQGIEGRTPHDRSEDATVAKVIDLAEVRRRRLVRRPFAHGLLNGYSLERRDEAA